jgi:hypothetical protein
MGPHQQQMMMQQRMQMSNMGVMRPNQMGDMGPGVGPGGMMGPMNGPMNGPPGMRPQMNPQMMMQMQQQQQQQMQMQQNRPPPPEYGKMMPQVRPATIFSPGADFTKLPFGRKPYI